MGSGGVGSDGRRGEEEGGKDAQFSLLGGGDGANEAGRSSSHGVFIHLWGDGDSTIRFYFLRRALPAL